MNEQVNVSVLANRYHGHSAEIYNGVPENWEFVKDRPIYLPTGGYVNKVNRSFINGQNQIGVSHPDTPVIDSVTSGINGAGQYDLVTKQTYPLDLTQHDRNNGELSL